jgi:hypothetical protein
MYILHPPEKFGAHTTADVPQAPYNSANETATNLLQASASHYENTSSSVQSIMGATLNVRLRYFIQSVDFYAQVLAKLNISTVSAAATIV